MEILKAASSCNMFSVMLSVASVIVNFGITLSLLKAEVLQLQEEHCSLLLKSLKYAKGITHILMRHVSPPRSATFKGCK